MRYLSPVAAHSSLQPSTTVAGFLISARCHIPHHVLILAFFSLSRFVNIGQTIMYEDTETSLLESESIFVSVSVDLQSFVGLQTISVHVIGTFTPTLPTNHPFLLPLLHFISWPTHTTPIRCSAQFWSCALVLLVCAC